MTSKTVTHQYPVEILNTCDFHYPNDLHNSTTLPTIIGNL